MHKQSCISAKHSSELGDFALDLHLLCISKAASRHNCPSKLGKFCSRFAFALHKQSGILAKHSSELGDFLSISGRALKMILEWLEIHREELLCNWDKAQKGMPLNKIEPLN